MKKTDALRQYSNRGKLNGDSISLILSGKAVQKSPPNRTPSVKNNTTVYARFFKPSKSVKGIQGIVEKALECISAISNKQVLLHDTIFISNFQRKISLRCQREAL